MAVGTVYESDWSMMQPNRSKRHISTLDIADDAVLMSSTPVSKDLPAIWRR